MNKKIKEVVSIAVKRVIQLALTLFCMMLITVAIWLVWHYQGLKPKLLFELSAASVPCNTFTSGPYSQLVQQSEVVLSVCRQRGISTKHVFATTGHKAVKFETYIFHGVHGDIAFETADPEIIYFYSYRKRYWPIVHQP